MVRDRFARSARLPAMFVILRPLALFAKAPAQVAVEAPPLAHQIAEIYAQRGEKTLAFDWLERETWPLVGPWKRLCLSFRCQAWRTMTSSRRVRAATRYFGPCSRGLRRLGSGTGGSLAGARATRAAGRRGLTA